MMSKSPNADNLLLGAGAVYFERLISANSWEASRHLGNCSSFNIHTEVIRSEVPNLCRNVTDLPQYTVTGFRVQGSIVLDEISKENVSLILAGAIDETYTQSSVTSTVQSYTATKGSIIPLTVSGVRKYGVTVSSVQSSGVELNSTNYMVHSRAGVIFIPDSSSLANNSTISVTFSAPNVVIPQISMANNTKVSGRLTFIGDPTAGPAYLCTIQNIELTFEDGLSLIGEDFTQVTATFIVTDHGKNAHSGTTGFYNLIELPTI